MPDECASVIPEHIRMAQSRNRMPLVSSVGIAKDADLKIANWRGQLLDVRTSARPDYHTVCFNLRGASVERLDKKASQLVERSIFIQPAFSSGHFHSEGICEYAHFYIRIGALNQLAETSGKRFDESAHLPDTFGIMDPSFVAVLRCCLDYLSTRSNPSRVELDSWALIVCGGLLDYLSARAFAARSRGTYCSSRIKRSIDLIHAQLTSDLSLQCLASESGMSHFQFSRAFKRATGQSPHQYILEQRVARAQELLKGQGSLSDIAYAVGFSSQAHMTDVFKKRLGVTPGQYRVDVLG